MGIEMDISTRQSECFAGDVVGGTVTVNVTAKDAGTSADALVLRVVGLIKTRSITKSTGLYATVSGAAAYTDHQVMSEDMEFLGYDVHLASFGGKMAAGEHSFPFSVVLPSELPPSMKDQGGEGSCAIAYGFKARLSRSGMLNFDAKAKAQLKVFSRPQETAVTLPVVVGPDTKVIKRCYCLKNGSMSVGFQVDRSALGLNESLGLTVVARNDSSASVKAMRIDIMQETTWYARGSKASNTRSIASAVVSGAELAAVEIGSKRGQSDAAVEDKAREDLRGQLAAGAGTRHEILVPGDASTTLQSENIEVRHLLSVRLETPSCVDSPDVWTPLRVQPHTVSMAAAAASLLARPPADAAPVSDVPPVSVPQSAVNMVYSNELPPYSGPGNR
ncbi:unnamed protein product [Pylaiella littoralis]